MDARVFFPRRLAESRRIILGTRPPGFPAARKKLSRFMLSEWAPVSLGEQRVGPELPPLMASPTGQRG